MSKIDGLKLAQVLKGKRWMVVSVDQMRDKLGLPEPERTLYDDTARLLAKEYNKVDDGA